MPGLAGDTPGTSKGSQVATLQLLLDAVPVFFGETGRQRFKAVQSIAKIIQVPLRGEPLIPHPPALEFHAANPLPAPAVQGGGVDFFAVFIRQQLDCLGQRQQILFG